jgi:ABC-type branched-subunit amino acid transport system substrate-binding protein
MKKASVLVSMIAAVLAAIIAATVGGSTASAAVLEAAQSCGNATVAFTGPYTGPAASAGLDQRNWDREFLTNWNAGKPIPGVPKGFKRTKLKAVEADTALNPQLAATVAVQLRSNKAILSVNGFSGSQENIAGGPILRRGGLSFVSGSATRASLTDPSTPDGAVLKNGFFRRVVPTDKAQGETDAAFVLKSLGVSSGDTVMTVDQAEAYSIPLISLITSQLQKAGVKVDRESQAATQTDFTSLANKAVGEKAKVVVLAGQVAANAQLFASQLKVDGFTGKFLGTDGIFDSSTFKVPGSYISSFSLDIHDVPVAAPFVAEFEKKFGKTISFGAPSFIAVQMMAMGISNACATGKGKTTRSAVRAAIGKVSITNSLLGKPIAFQASGDVKGGVGFTIFQIGSDGSYNVVQKG